MSAPTSPVNPAPPPAEKDFAEDQKTFEQLPARTKELVVLEDRAAKAIGLESVVIAKLIREKSKS